MLCLINNLLNYIHVNVSRVLDYLQLENNSIHDFSWQDLFSLSEISYSGPDVLAHVLWVEII